MHQAGRLKNYFDNNAFKISAIIARNIIAPANKPASRVNKRPPICPAMEFRLFVMVFIRFVFASVGRRNGWPSMTTIVVE